MVFAGVGRMGSGTKRSDDRKERATPDYDAQDVYETANSCRGAGLPPYPVWEMSFLLSYILDDYYIMQSNENQAPSTLSLSHTPCFLIPPGCMVIS